MARNEVSQATQRYNYARAKQYKLFFDDERSARGRVERKLANDYILNMLIYTNR